MPNIFGLPTPQETQQAQFAQNLQLLSRARPGQALGAVAGQGLGSALGGALGLESGKMQRARLMQEAQAEVAQSGLQPGQEGYLDAVTRALSGRGLNAEAQMARVNGAKMEQEVLKAEKLNQEVTSVRRRNEALKARGPYAQMFSLLQEGATADKKNALNIAGSTDAATQLARAGIDTSLYSGFLEGVANDIQATMATNVSTTASSSVSDLDAGVDRTGSTRSARISRGQLDAIVAKNLQELGIDLRQLQPSVAVQGQQIQPTQPRPRSLPSPSRADTSPITNQPYIRGEPLPTIAAPRQKQTALPTRQGRTLPQNEVRRGRVLEGGRDYTLEDVAQNSSNGKVAFGSQYTKNQLRNDFGHGEKTIQAQNKESLADLKVIRSQVSGINDLANYIEENGQAFPSLMNSIVRAFGEAGRSGDNILASAATLSASILKILPDVSEITGLRSRDERRVLDGISRRIIAMRLTEKERQKLGVLTGNDYELVSRLFPSPSEYTSRVTGVRAWFENISGVQESLYRGASNAVNDGAIKRFDLAAPSSLTRLAGMTAEQDIRAVLAQAETGRTTPKAAADNLSSMLGFRVTPRMVNIMTAQNDFGVRGDFAQQAIGTVQQGAEAVRGAASQAREGFRQLAAPVPGQPPPRPAPTAPGDFSSFATDLIRRQLGQ